MSRPFSYNDENFTVIDNLLFIHFRDDNKHESNEPVLLIPQSIYERMVTNSFIFLSQLAGNKQASDSVSATTIEVNGKHFISFINYRPQSTSPRYYIGFSQMKDI